MHANNCAQHVESGRGAQFLLESCMAARRRRAQARTSRIAYTNQVQQVPSRVGEAVEVVGNGEMLNNIAFPGVDHAPVGLEPLSHSAPPIFAAPVLRAYLPVPDAVADSGPRDRANLGIAACAFLRRPRATP